MALLKHFSSVSIRSRFPWLRLILPLAFAMLCLNTASAQGRGGAPPPSGRLGGEGHRASPAARPEPGRPPRPNQLGGPAGRWWDDPAYVRSVGINRAQQKRMDDVFGANRGQLQRLYSDFKKQEAQLSKATKTSGISEAQLDSQIDRVAQARSELQKATTHMLLELRGELSPEQVNRLEAAPQQ